MPSYLWKNHLAIDVETIKAHWNCRGLALDLGCGTMAAARIVSSSDAVIVGIDRTDVRPVSQMVRLRGDVVEVLRSISAGYNFAYAFGLVSYLDDERLMLMYNEVRRVLYPGSSFVLKHQCGTTRRVEVDVKRDDALGARYQAVYRTLPSDKSLLRRAGFSIKESYQLPSQNTHTDTLWRVIVATA
jgi:hypothetical protein